MKSCTLNEASTQLDRLFEAALAGEVVLLTKGTRQVVLRQAEGEPVPVRPPGYFSDCYSDEDAAESNRLASASPTALVD
ncbi:MAG: hypothetical protein FD161_1006 [Limisphaerales bacterium]|nr:MAG: hypothetical protein FD161_1006 [Limisphaerales bacterium]KAG0509789.1 MAG: hypothetical protein E1N63_1006 [Limisphaerales bacterium]TXT50989.1 MAG: hypothetical protein FD140_2051 [Limisphaerales bacterium]